MTFDYADGMLLMKKGKCDNLKVEFNTFVINFRSNNTDFQYKLFNICQLFK